MADYIKGNLIIIYIYDATAWKPIACLTQNTLNQTRDIIEVQTKCSTDAESSVGSLKYDITFEGKYIDTTSTTNSDKNSDSHDKLFQIMNAGTEIEWKMDTGLTDNDAYFGKGYLTALSLNAGSGNELVDFSGTINGTGVITTTDPH